MMLVVKVGRVVKTRPTIYISIVLANETFNNYRISFHESVPSYGDTGK